MQIRTYQHGDEGHQAATYNEAARDLPNFKPATIHEISRRTNASDFDPTMRFYATTGTDVVGYCLFNPNGRVSYPWCRKGYEELQPALFQKVIDAMQERGLKKAFAAYRKDWPSVGEFFERNGFVLAREMVNFVQDLVEMPTVPHNPSTTATDLKRSDVPTIFHFCPEALRVDSPEGLEKHLFHNPYFGPESFFVLRRKTDSEAVGVGVVITELTFADPMVVDPLMPCFRLGAFGTETMQTKRLKGLFSFLAAPDNKFPIFALDALGQATLRIEALQDITSLAAQVPSNVEHLLQFYEGYFTRQGSFPVYERNLGRSN